MIDLRLITYMNEQLRQTPMEFYRYMYDKILWNERLVGIVGPRGVGKSTMVKQYILNQENRKEWIYVSVDHSYFTEHTIVDFAESCIKEGIGHIAIGRKNLKKYMIRILLCR